MRAARPVIIASEAHVTSAVAYVEEKVHDKLSRNRIGTPLRTAAIESGRG